MEHSPEQAEPSVVFVDEEGNEKEMLVIGTFSLQDTTYAVLIDKNRPEEDGVMMKVQENNEEASWFPSKMTKNGSGQSKLTRNGWTAKSQV